ncbi:Crp/Fnr family transcriptional regulator [Oceanisphaera avium]|nr:Crp/Fnr family transcriptional regulator [Oceanisphaera avium]
MPNLNSEPKLIANQLWGAMPHRVRQRLAPFLKRVPLTSGTELTEAGKKCCFVYFPTHGQVTIFYVMSPKYEVVIASVGKEGIVGACTLVEGPVFKLRSLVNVSGSAYRLPSSLLKTELVQNTQLQSVFLSYLHQRMLDASQMALCNRFHTIEQQLSRFLLSVSTAAPAQHIFLTQELIAKNLGVRREGVTLAASKLQRLGVICYHRGHIHILNREHLSQCACECDFDASLPI